MTTAQPIFKKPALIALAAMFVLLTGALVFYKERMLFIDATGTIFRLVNIKKLLIPENRFGSVVTLWVPLTGAKYHWSLSTIMVVYSLSFNFFYFLVAGLLVFAFRQYLYAILMALYYTLYASDAYFWTNNEVHQGIAWMFLFLAVMQYLWQYQKSMIVQVPAFLLLATTAVFCHPLIIVATLFLWGFLWMSNRFNGLDVKAYVFFSFLLAAIIGVKIWFSFHQSYDTRLLTKAAKTPLKLSVEWLRRSIGIIFLKHLLINYWVAIIVFCLGMYALLKERKIWLMAWCIAGAVGFLALISIVFAENADGDRSFFYLEGEWMTMAVITAAPFVFHYLPRIRPANVQWGLVLIFLVRFTYIGCSAPRFTRRIEAVENILANMRRVHFSKVILLSNDTLKDKLLVDYELAEESMILSKLHGDKPQLTVTQATYFELPAKLSGPDNVMVHFFGPMAFPLNPDYFMLDTTQPYKVALYEHLNK